MLPPSIRAFNFYWLDSPRAVSAQPSNAEYHLHPHYRTARPLDALLLKTEAGDDFVTEKYAGEIAAVLMTRACVYR